MIINSTVNSPKRFAGVKRRNLAGWIGTLGLASAVLGLGASTAAVNIGILLLLLGAILVLDDIVNSIGIGQFLLAVMLTAFLLFATLWATFQLQVDTDTAWGNFRLLVKSAGLPSLAAGWWLLRGHLRYHHVLVLLSLSVIIGCFGGIDFETLFQTPFAGRRIISDINANKLGFLAGILFLVSCISLLLDERSKSALPGSTSSWNIFFVLSAGLTGFLVISSQSRAVILGICLALITVFCVRILATRHKILQQGRRYAVITISILALLGLVAFSPLSEVLTKRFEGLEKSLHLLTNLGVDPQADLGGGDVRLLMWQQSLPLIADAPLIGHGPGTAPELLAKSSRREIRHFKHFHNLWIHLLVTIGIPGALGFAVLFLGLAIRSARDAVKHDRHISWTALGLWVYFILLTLAQLRINHASGQAFVLLVGGMSYYCAFDTRQTTPGK